MTEVEFQVAVSRKENGEHVQITRTYTLTRIVYAPKGVQVWSGEDTASGHNLQEAIENLREEIIRFGRPL